VSAKRPGIEKIIEKVRILRYSESTETDLHIAENTWYIDYSGTGFSKRVHWLSKSQSPRHGTTNYGCEDKLEFDPGVAWASLPITRISQRVAPKSKIQGSPATVHNSRSMDHCQVRHGSSEAMPIFDPVDVEEAYSLIASCYHNLEWQVPSYRRRHESFCCEEDSIEGNLVLCHEVSTTEAFQILCWSDTSDGYTSHFCTYPWSFLELMIVQEVGQENGY